MINEIVEVKLERYDEHKFSFLCSFLFFKEKFYF